MSRELELDMDAGQERLREIRDEVGFDPDAEEQQDPDKLWEYVEALESAVVGSRAAMKLIARTMGR